MLTFLPIEQIDEMDKWEGAQLNQAKEILAFELTKLVHGEEEAQKAQDAAKALFAQGGDKSNVPTTTLDTGDLTDGAIEMCIRDSPGGAEKRGHAGLLRRRRNHPPRGQGRQRPQGAYTGGQSGQDVYKRQRRCWLRCSRPWVLQS